MKNDRGFRVPALLVATCAWIALYAPGSNAQRTEEIRPLPELPSGIQTKARVYAKHQMVVAAHPAATDAGLAILRKGGSAVDAAIAVQMVLGLVEPHASGIGGGAFLLHFDAKKKSITGYDGRESAPMEATPTLFIGKDGKPLRFADAVVGGRSVGVPGVVRALEVAHARHGKLPWKTLFEPAISMAENGFPLEGRLYQHLARGSNIGTDPALRAYLLQTDGTPKARGTALKNPAYAATLRQIARDGADAFYIGEIAADMVSAVRNHTSNPGLLNIDDLKGYRARSVTPICGPYRTYRVCGMPPPSSGGISVLQMLQTLERFDLKALRPMSTESIHLFSEAGRLIYADRDRYLADADFAKVPIAGLTDPTYNKKRGELIKVERSMSRAAPGNPEGVTLAHRDDDALERGGTSHYTIVDREGNTIAVTSSIESNFGSRIFVRGFLLNNQLTDFSLSPSDGERIVANAVYPGKRPRSAMSPTMVFDRDGKLTLALGSALGSHIVNFVAKSIVATLDWDLDIQAAMEMPHFGSRNGPTELEKGTSAEKLSSALQAMGHEVRVGELPSGLHGIMRTPQGWLGGVDPRRDGTARGD